MDKTLKSGDEAIYCDDGKYFISKVEDFDSLNTTKKLNIILQDLMCGMWVKNE